MVTGNLINNTLLEGIRGFSKDVLDVLVYRAASGHAVTAAHSLGAEY